MSSTAGRCLGRRRRASAWRRRASRASISIFDATDPQAVQAAVAEIEAEDGPIDILINNAGIQHRAPLQDFPFEAFRHVLETNLFSAFYVGQAVARRMIPRRRGSIVNVCSVQSELGRPSIAPYAASKGGLKMLTKGMAVDWGPHGIRVNGLGPGYFKTELNQALVRDPEFTAWLEGRTPLGRWGEVGGTDRGGAVPRVGRLELRDRPRALRRRRHHQQPLTMTESRA